VSWRLDNAHKIYAPDEFHILGGSTILEVVNVADLRIQINSDSIWARAAEYDDTGHHRRSPQPKTPS
jgi:hypothetical protein